jgi:hypothetical protein
MAAMGDHVLVSDGSHLRALDVSDPAEPREIGALGLEGGVDVAVADGLAYVVTLGGGLSIVDLTDPVNPRLLGTFSTSSGSIYNVALSGEYAFTTAGDETGLLVLDVTDPTAPRSAGALPRLFGGPVALAGMGRGTARGRRERSGQPG